MYHSVKHQIDESANLQHPIRTHDTLVFLNPGGRTPCETSDAIPHIHRTKSSSSVTQSSNNSLDHVTTRRAFDIPGEVNIYIYLSMKKKLYRK